jgi:hypothetical protein
MKVQRQPYKYDQKYGQRPWSKFARDIRNLFAKDIPLQIHCIARPLKSREAMGSTRFPRYWLTLGKETIFDYPSMFMDIVDHEASAYTKERYGLDVVTVGKCYPYEKHGVSEISELIRSYIECPKDKLLEPFENDRWGLTEILRAADRRIGKQRLREIKTENEGAKKIISLRLGKETAKEKE